MRNLKLVILGIIYLLGLLALAIGCVVLLCRLNNGLKTTLCNYALVLLTNYCIYLIVHFFKDNFRKV